MYQCSLLVRHHPHKVAQVGPIPTTDTFSFRNQEMNTHGIWTCPNRLGGKPCVSGERFSVAQLLAELAGGRSLKDIAEKFDIPHESLINVLHDLSKLFDKDWTKENPP